MFCMHCRGPHDVVITIERRGILAHYHACFDHIEQVANRLRSDVGVQHASLAERSAAARRAGAIDTNETPRQIGSAGKP